MTRLSNALIVAVGLLLASPTQAVADTFPWRHDLDAARAEAAQSGRLILAHFWAPWCGPCKRLDQSVFSRPEVAKAITANYVPVKLNADQNRSLAEHLGIKGVPNDVIFTPDGQVVGQFVSPATPDAYVSRMGQVAASVARPNSNPQVVATATASPSNKARATATQPVNSAYANLAVSTDGPATSQTPPVIAVPVLQMAHRQAPTTNGLAVAPNRPAATQPPTTSAQQVAMENGAYRSQPPVAQTTPSVSYTADRYGMPKQPPQGAANGGKTASSPDLGRYAVVNQTGTSNLPPETAAPGAYKPPTAPAFQPPVQSAPPTAQIATNQPPSQVAAPPRADQIAVAASPSSAPRASSYMAAQPAPQGLNNSDPRTGFTRPAANTSPTAQNPIDFSRRQVSQNLAPQSSAVQNPAVRPPASQTPAPSPLGLDGYCPISLQNSSLPPNDSRRWVRGNARWGAVHRGKTYLFAGQAERDQFLQSPDTYAPVLSGMDPVLAFGSGQMVSGKRELGVWYGGKIFLFSSEQSIERFSQNPDQYVERIRQAMGVGKPTTLR